MAQFWPQVPTDSGWITPTLNTGWTAAGSEVPAYRLLGKVVAMRGRANSTGATQYAFTLPPDLWPEFQAVGQTDNGGTPMRCIVTAAGQVGQTGAAVAAGFSFGDFPQVIAR